MPSKDLGQLLGEAVFLGLLAEPFFHVGTDLLMNGERSRAIISYLVGSIPATAGLIALGVIKLGWLPASEVRDWVAPILSDPRWWLAVLLFFLLWLGGPRWIEKTTGRPNVRYWPLVSGALVLLVPVFCLHGPFLPLDRSQATITPSSDINSAVILGNSRLKTQVAALSAQLIQPKPTPLPAPRQIDVNDALNFLSGFRHIHGKCPITITTTMDNYDIEQTLLRLIQFPYVLSGPNPGDAHWDDNYFIFNSQPAFFETINTPGQKPPRFAGFDEINLLPTPTPILDEDASPTPTSTQLIPTGEIVVHAPSGVDNADLFVQLLTDLRLKAVRGFKYPLDAKPIAGLVYVQIGSGSLWLK